ncbi:anhydro-N-acetylmuramic acid kinase [Chitinilyticum litopenaei]|uniref:anhydro-N-acetylmuramic acid kinase n=1 Tax=Chitinilyticum litopenaei TaxID=1121276 RepID=UPI000408FDC2|nr:anhydro-N-acetylmuramic acid kinase [Chitinilyticum litopenaei]
MTGEYLIGLMSGTSLDGIDGVLVELQDQSLRLLASHSMDMPAKLRAELLALQAASADELHRAMLAGNALAEAYARVCQALLKLAGLPASAVAAIGNHGQTIRHRPECGYTLQLANNALLAELAGIPVIGDFRSRDVAAGGQGAPLVPAFHRAMFGQPGQTRAVVNIGGFANVSWLAADGSSTGWDTGPGNVLMDLWIQGSQGHTYDENGQWAASGTASPALLARLLADPYFALPAPKSTGRDHFHAGWLAEKLQGLTLAAADVAATLSTLTVSTIASDLRRAGTPDAVYVCGGGAANRHLMQQLTVELAPVPVFSTTEAGIAPQWVEACAFAWLAHRCLAGLPGNLPAVTGATGPRVLGAIWPA